MLKDTDAQSGGLYNASSSLLIGPGGSASAVMVVDDFRIYNEVLDTTKMATIISAANP